MQMENDGSKSYFVVVDVKIPVVVTVEARTDEDARERGEAQAREIIEKYMKPRNKEAVQYVAVKVTEARPLEQAEA